MQKEYAIIAQICKNMQLLRKYAKNAIMLQKYIQMWISHLLKDLNYVILLW